MERFKWSVLSRFKKLPTDPSVEALTEGQWTWLMVHMSIDNDERLENTCNKCKDEMEKHKCQSCGEEIFDYNANESFDESMFERLKKESSS